MANDKKIWLSHSGLEILYRCPRCFWLKYNKGIEQPEGVVSRLPDRFDRIIKNYFSLYRKIGELPPMIEGKVKGKLENPFQEIYFYSLNEKYGFYGKLDECLISEDKKYTPVDFKTSSSDPREKGTLQAYQNQLDEFSFLLEMNGKKTSGIGHLIYFYPQQSKNLHNGFPMLVHVETIKTKPEEVKPRLLEAIKILEGNIPKPAKDCEFCRWYDQVGKVLNEI